MFVCSTGFGFGGAGFGAGAAGLASAGLASAGLASAGLASASALFSDNESTHLGLNFKFLGFEKLNNIGNRDLTPNNWKNRQHKIFNHRIEVYSGMVVDTKATVTYVEALKEDLAVFRITPNEGGMPEYKAGQFLTIGMPIVNENYKIIRRAYSIASHPENRKYFEFVIRWVRSPLPGRVTTQMFYASEGEQVLLGKPTGNALTINETLHDGRRDNRRIVCIGGGTGIAPFVSFAKHLRAIGSKREIVVFHGVSYADELSYRELFTQMQDESFDRGKDKWNFRYGASISRPQEWFNRSWNGPTGRVENFLKPQKAGGKSYLEELVGEKITTENTSFYICGWQGTIDGVMNHLSPLGFVTEHEKREDGSFEVKYESYG